MRKVDRIKALINNSQLIAEKEGLSVLAAKSADKIMSPIIGGERSKLFQYNFNKLLDGRHPGRFTNTVTNIDIRLESDEYQIFFGFYDKTPFCPENRRILFNRTKVSTRPVNESDILEMCYYDVEKDEIQQFGETRTWNWQQGCRLQWVPETENCVIYNKIVDDDFGAVIQNVETGETIRTLPAPVYDVGPHGEFAISLNFARLERLEFDYGYVNFDDETANQAAPASDGIYRVDLENSERRLLFSYEHLARRMNSPEEVHNYAMNIMISPDGEMFSFLHRYHQNGSRKTNLLCSDMEGETITVLQDKHEASHPIWRSNSELLSTINKKTQIGKETELVLFDVADNKREVIEIEQIHFDTHPSFSPANYHLIVGDSYPNKHGERRLFISNPWKNQFELLGKIYGPVLNGVKRDLHPRWDREGKYICIDVPLPENKRGMHIVELTSENNLSYR